MVKVILFGGGDGGGLIIGPSGVRPIPPFDPSLRSQLHGVSSLVHGQAMMADERRSGELATAMNRLTNVVVDTVEGTVGPIDEHDGLVFLTEEGGFALGSSGKPPRPIQWPAVGHVRLSDLLSTGVLDREMFDLVEAAARRDQAITEVLERPDELARELGVPLSEQAASDLRSLAVSRRDQLHDPVDREIVDYFHKVLEDGRFLETWATRPHEVTAELKIELSDQAFDRVVAGGSGVDPTHAALPPVAVAVAVGVLVMLVTDEARVHNIPVIDRSGIAKF